MKSKRWVFVSHIILDAYYERKATLQLLQTLLNEKQIVFKRWTTIRLYAQTNFHD